VVCRTDTGEILLCRRDICYSPAALSPSGAWVAYVSLAPETAEGVLNVAPVGGPDAARHYVLPGQSPAGGHANATAISWSPDECLIALGTDVVRVAEAEGGARTEHEHAVMLMEVATGRHVVLESAKGDRLWMDVGWQEAGPRPCYVWDGELTTCAVDTPLSGTEPAERVRIAPATSAHVSPDGSIAAVLRQEGEEWTLAIYDTDGWQLRAERAVSPQFAPGPYPRVLDVQEQSALIWGEEGYLVTLAPGGECRALGEMHSGCIIGPGRVVATHKERIVVLDVQPERIGEHVLLTLTDVEECAGGSRRTAPDHP
jgi:hypothetical protein